MSLTTQSTSNQGQDQEGVKGRTFTKIAYMLAIGRSTMIVNVCNQNLAEGFHNGSPNIVIGYPFDGRFHLNVAPLLSGAPPAPKYQRVKQDGQVFDPLHIINTPMPIVLLVGMSAHS